MSQTRGIPGERLDLIIRADYSPGACCGAMGRAGFGIDVGLAYLPSRISFAAPDIGGGDMSNRDSNCGLIRPSAFGHRQSPSAAGVLGGVEIGLK